MKKKLLYTLIALFGLVGGLYFYTAQHATKFSTTGYCAFCNPQVLDYQKFYEDDLVLALYTHKPVQAGHCLIISKRHVERFDMLSVDEMTQIGQTIQKVDHAVKQVFKTSSYFLHQKNGLEAWQTVPHVHFHYVPRETGDTSALKFLAKMWISNIKDPIPPAEMHEVVAKLQEALKSL